MLTRRTGNGPENVEVMPTHCPCGAAYLPDNVLIAHLPCSCAGTRGHRSYTCNTCGLIVYEPPHNSGADVLTGRWDG